MKLRAIALGIVAFYTSTTAFAGIVSTSSNLEILAIDGQKASKSLLKEGKSFNISDTNTHQIVVRLGEIIGSGSNQSLFESSPIVVTFQGTAEDIIINAPDIRSHSAGEKFNESPSITIQTKSGNNIPVKADALKQEGLFPGTNVLSDLAEYNASNAHASVPAFATITATPIMATSSIAPTNSKANKDKVTVQGKNVAEQQLQYWFQQADKETQTRFLNWAKSQK